jgi:hypothetical protein
MMKVQMSINILTEGGKGGAASTVTVPYEHGVDVRVSVGTALVQLLGLTLDKALAQVQGCRP